MVNNIFELLGHAPEDLAQNMRTAEFRALIRDRTRNFVGREFIIQAVESRLTEPGFDSGYVIVNGEPGIGKSALAATLVERHGWVHHFNIAPSNIRSVGDFMRNVCAQLIVRYGLPHDSLPVSVDRDSGFLLRLLDEAAAGAENRPVVVLVDALDEADDTGLSPANNRLLLPPVLPEGVFIVATTRPKQDYRLQVDSRRDLWLDYQDPQNLQDVRAYIERFVDANGDVMQAQIAAWKVDADVLANVLTDRSEGNFMYLVRVLDDIRDGRITAANIEDVRSLPRGLRDYYERHWREMKAADPEHFTTIEEPVVCTLATVREPVALSEIAEWARIDVGEVRQVIEEWREYFDEQPGDPEPRYRIYHASFLDFLAGKVDLARFHQEIGDSAMGKIRLVNGVREDNPVHDLNPYELRHLGEHLAAAGNAADLERLLALDWRRVAPVEEQPAPPQARPRLWSRRSREPAEPSPPRTVEFCRNAWYEAKEAIGDPGGYRGDVERAWRMAAQACAEAVHAGIPAPADRELRCALLAASVNSIGSGLPGELLRAQVERGTWTEAHALFYARQRGAADRQPKLAALLPALSSETRAELLPELLSERPDEERPKVLQALAPFLDLDQIRAVRAELNECSEGYARSQAATALVRRLVELGRVEEAYQVVTTEMPHENVAAEALTELAPQLDEAHVDRAFEVARGWEPAGSLPIASIGLCERLAAFGRVREALDMARQLDLPYQQARLVAQMAPLLDRETRAEVLALLPTGGAMEDIRAKALLALADKAAADGETEEATGMVDDAIATIGGIEYEYSRKTAIAMVAPELCAARPEAALSLAEGIEEPGERIVALGAIGAHLTGALRERAKEDALAADSADLSDDALTALASFEPSSAFTIVRRRVAQLGQYGQQRDLVVAVAPYLPSELLAEARDLLVTVDDERRRDDARAAIAGELVVCGDPSGFERLAAMDATDERRAVMADVAQRVPDDLFDQTFELINALSGHDLEDPVKAAAPRLSPEQQQALLDRVAANDYDWAYSKVLQALAPYLDSALIEHALELALSRHDEAWQAWALVAIVPRLDSGQLARVRERIPKLSQEYDFQREAMASAVATRLAELGLADEAFTLASSITREARWQSEALCGLAQHLGAGRDRIEKLAKAINDPVAHADALAALAARAEEPDRSRLFDRAVALARAATVGESAGPDPVTLARLARHGGAEMVDRALEDGEVIGDHERPDLIENLGALGPAEAESAAALARDIDEPGQRAEAFAKLLDRTPDPSPELVAEALRAIAAGGFAIYRKTQLRTVLDALLEQGHEAVEAEWSGVLPLLAERGRSELMSDVCAVVRVVGFLGGVDALRATEHAIQDVERWWP